MNRFMSLMTAVAVALVSANLALAGDGRMHGNHSHMKVHSYSGKYNHKWSHCYFNSKHGCYEYWCPSSHCYYYWCAPAACYYPVSYCPYSTFCFEKPSNYAADVPVVTAPVVGAATATATATATASATAAGSVAAGPTLPGIEK